ncbi:MAG: DUF47 family protein [Polyangia bacterium]|jgi:predicted phosphate transport protein (TIGR00153 family)|nr:DUF47 family protein [Polyangia bacterium]
MSLFFKKERAVLSMIHQYFAEVDLEAEVFREAMNLFLTEGAGEAFTVLDGRVHRHESRADDLRCQIEKEMYSHALLPESRGDLLGLLETFDKIPNLLEVVTFMIDTQRIEVPPKYRPQVLKLVEVNLEAYKMVRDIVDRLFGQPDSVENKVSDVDHKESEGDHIERDLIKSIFLEDLPGLQKVQLRELIQRIGDISDHSEKLARRVELISLKKRI